MKGSFPRNLANKQHAHRYLQEAFDSARARDPETWATLFAMADPRFEFRGITIPPQARVAIMLAEWQGDEPEIQPVMTSSSSLGIGVRGNADGIS